MNLHNNQMYLLEQHSESFNIWSAIIRINTEGKSLIIKLGPGIIRLNCCAHILTILNMPKMWTSTNFTSSAIFYWIYYNLYDSEI